MSICPACHEPGAVAERRGARRVQAMTTPEQRTATVAALADEAAAFAWWVPQGPDADGRAHAFPVAGPGWGMSTCRMVRWSVVSRKVGTHDPWCPACIEQQHQRIAERTE